VRVSYHRKLFEVVITRSEFEDLTADLFQRTRDTIELVLELAEVDPTSLDHVLVIGGATRMPAVLQMLERICGQPPCRTLYPQLAVAQGAAIHAAILDAQETGRGGRMAQSVLKRLQSVSTIDVNSHSLGVEISDPQNSARKRNHIMIPRNTHLPAAAEQQFVTTLPNPPGIEIRLLEGEAAESGACTLVGRLRIAGLPPNLPVGSPVQIIYRYDAQRRIHVSARELTTNKAASVQIVWENSVNRDAMQMLSRLASEYQVE